MLAAVLDLMDAVQNADPTLVTDEILEAAGRLEDVVGEHRGNL